MAHPERVGSSWKSFVAKLRVGKTCVAIAKLFEDMSCKNVVRRWTTEIIGTLEVVGTFDRNT